METHVVDRQAQFVEDGERHRLATPVQAEPITQFGTAIGRAGGRIDQQRKLRDHGGDIPRRVEERAGDPAGAAQGGVHDAGHCCSLRGGVLALPAHATRSPRAREIITTALAVCLGNVGFLD